MQRETTRSTCLLGSCTEGEWHVRFQSVRSRTLSHVYRNGIEVANDAGDGPWQLTGDGHLTDQTLQIMRRAVQQSIANITDPAQRRDDNAVCFARVWRFTPKLTNASRPTVIALVQEYTNPASTRLSDAAAAIITAKTDELIHLLVDKYHKLRPA